MIVVNLLLLLLLSLFPLNLRAKQYETLNIRLNMQVVNVKFCCSLDALLLGDLSDLHLNLIRFTKVIILALLLVLLSCVSPAMKYSVGGT